MRPFPPKLRTQFSVFKKLNTPAKVQNFLDTLPINFEPNGDTCSSPKETLRLKRAHCMEGALLAAAIFWYHGEAPLLLDLKTTKKDESHVVTLFRRNGLWGAVSKTNHAVLRYRDPIFKTPRELALSYFNEYFLDNGKKTLRSFYAPFNLGRYGTAWLTAEEPLWHIVNDIDTVPHKDIVPKKYIRHLRPADAIEIEAGKITAWKKSKKPTHRNS